MRSGARCSVKVRRSLSENEKLRTEIALGRETLEDFDETRWQLRKAKMPYYHRKPGKLAGQYISAHNTPGGSIRAKQIWKISCSRMVRH